MTSPANNEQTKAFFKANEYFDFPRDNVRFFVQGQMPSFSLDGKLMLADKRSLALSPDGHGGVLTALRKSGCLDELHQLGVEHLSYFQVDNPLVRCIDPLFIGLHAIRGSEMASKTISKADDKEKVGNFCMHNGKLNVIEYIDFPDELATAKNSDGSRRFDAGSIAIHVLDVNFAGRLTEGEVELPFHRAEKKVPCIDPGTGEHISPEKPNAVKLEKFIFDALPLARYPVVLETGREEEFSPVKNLTGTDSVVTSRRDVIRRAARWLEEAGVVVPRKQDGEPDAVIEISPLLGGSAEELKENVSSDWRIAPGSFIYLK
jgi:UDP-N-acetylglucosamine/UDP-N-acetylgalactosamine diphosphorylase